MQKINEIKIGDFVQGVYKCGCVCGVVVKIKKSVVIIKQCKPHYNEYTKTNFELNLTKSRIYQIGLNENEKIINL